MMKSLSILVAAASVAVATFDNLPSCGQVCMTNMNNIAINDFGCAQGNIVCYCEKINYGYGIRDCANEACSSPQDAANVISYGSNYCAGALSSAAPSTPSAPGYSILSSAAGGVPSGSGTTSPSPTGTATTGTGTGTGAGGLRTAISTVSGTTIITSGSQVLTTTGAISTLFSTLTSAPGSVASSLSSVVSSVNSSLTSEISGAASSASATGSAIASSLTASGSATSTSSEAAAPLATAAPLLGAGAMAVLLAAL